MLFLMQECAVLKENSDSAPRIIGIGRAQRVKRWKWGTISHLLSLKDGKNQDY